MKRIALVLIVVTIIPIIVFEFWVKRRGNEHEVGGHGSTNTIASPDDVVGEVIVREKLLSHIQKRLDELKAAVEIKNLSRSVLPETFNREFSYRPIVGFRELSTSNGIRKQAAKFGETSFGEIQTRIWEKLFAQIEQVSYAKFVAVQIVSRQHGECVVETNIQCLAKSKSGSWMSIDADGTLKWITDELGRWLIADWAMSDVSVSETDELLFSDQTSKLLAPDDLAHVQQSEHYRIIRKLFQPGSGGFRDELQQNFFPRGGAIGRHPSIAIVDINADGWDDLYLCEQWRRNLLYINSGTGPWQESAAQFGLDSPGYDSAALFADFDNDGDQDLLLGRSLGSSKFLVNESGQFVDRTEAWFNGPLPALVSSIAAADYDNDGKLDFYLSTYGFHQVNVQVWTSTFLDSLQQSRIVDRSKLENYSQFLGAVGPKNHLFINQGDRFEVSPLNEQVAVWANSTQSVWTDYDLDGDQDLFVVNDRNVDNLFRNDVDSFVDVSSLHGQSKIGFGKGVSVGDVDLDGQQDFFVSNVHSPSGQRIIDGFEVLDDRFDSLADGDRIYRNSGQALDQIDGLAKSVASGWSFGGQFIDVENDGFLDVYVPSGFFTPPADLTTGKDLDSEFWRSVIRTKGGVEEEYRKSERWNDREVLPGQWYDTIATRKVDGRPRLSIHEHAARQRNRLLGNRKGKGFDNLSKLSGADSVADGRCFAILDYDRDGASDMALVNMNSPHLQIFRNQIAAQTKNRFVAIRLVGGNSDSAASDNWSNRDAVGALVTVICGGRKHIREHRKGEGFSSQNSSTMIFGIGASDQVQSIEVQWPSGRNSMSTNLQTNQMVIVYENPGDSPDGSAFVSRAYQSSLAASEHQPAVENQDSNSGSASQ